ncbi:MAG: endonuclease/exonuclease/phosphatase family protein [Paludibacter sp.]|nr:endonuclease/exonuclease/phosphatase family protein [Paludibacter sp.]
MKLVYKYGVLFFLLIVCNSAFGAGQNDTLNVMTFNIRFGELASLEQIGKYIKSQQPDIVALQECDWKLDRGDRALQQAGKAYINELAYYSELFGLYGKTINYKGGYYGIGLLSKYPIIKSERVLLPNPSPKTEQRAMLMAEIELPDNSVITFISTHLEVSSAKTRKAQINFINRKISGIKTPVLLAGDFNATPNDQEIKGGFEKWFNGTNSEFTFSAKKPSIKIDYIWGMPQKNFELISTKVHNDCRLSDHFPVNSMIVLKK